MRVCIQSLEKMLKRAKTIFFLQKFKMGIKKQNFTLISNPLKKLKENVQKKVLGFFRS